MSNITPQKNIGGYHPHHDPKPRVIAYMTCMYVTDRRGVRVLRYGVVIWGGQFNGRWAWGPTTSFARGIAQMSDAEELWYNNERVW